MSDYQELTRKGTPELPYPDECWLCGTYVEDCPVLGDIRMEYSLNQRVGWNVK